MTETATRIRWEQETAQDVNGYVGTLDTPMFQLWRTPCDYGDVLIGDWVLSSGVPKLASHHLHSSRDLDVLKAEAERWLERFVSSLGAVFPPESPPTKRASRTARDFYRSVIEPAPSAAETSAPRAGEKE
jgi:hypothetical protein